LTYVRLDYVGKAIGLAERFQMENHGDLSNWKLGNQAFFMWIDKVNELMKMLLWEYRRTGESE
jgi:hypothetical protein